MSRRAALLLFAVALSARPAPGQGFSPDEAVKRMKLPPGFTVTCVAAEPTIRQPLSLSFDERGRLWVLQYLQYPDPAGLKAVKRDQYLRTIWDKLPDPPPKGPKGADRITILSDPDANGVFRNSKDFATGLNLGSGFCIGSGGVYVAQPPYLLFYPDADRDDVPDRDPDVLLTGFGLDDTHSLANSLQWGPDGWLYGAAGSTSTSRITDPANPKSPPIEFQQGIWRYHPKSKRFELFSEGGGNTYGLDFDRHGQAIAGTNWGGFACLHQMQGAYYVKGFSKHGPLHNPHAYGYFDHVPCNGFKGGHVTCGGIVYQADGFPPEYRDQYIGANLLSNAIYWYKLEPNGSTFKSSHAGELLEANDTWFRPVDLCQGPDGAVYVADWYDARAAHLDPIDTWDRTNGRVYRIAYKGSPKLEPLDLRAKPSTALVDLLKHPNVWWRREAPRLLAERELDPELLHTIRIAVVGKDEPFALEALWLLNGRAETPQDKDLAGWAINPIDSVRMWAIRLLGDRPNASTAAVPSDVPGMTIIEHNPAVLAQIACTAKRLPPAVGTAVASELLRKRAIDHDRFLPLLTWWTLEAHAATDSDAVQKAVLGARSAWNSDTGRLVLERITRRFLASDPPQTWNVLELLDAAESYSARGSILTGVELAVKEHVGRTWPSGFVNSLSVRGQRGWTHPALDRTLVRVGDVDARTAAVARLADAKRPEPERIAALELLSQVRATELPPLLPPLLAQAKSDAFRLAVLAALEAGGDPKTADIVLEGHAKWSPAVRKRAVALLTSRPAWAVSLLNAVDSGTFPKAALTVDAIRPAVTLNDPTVMKLVEKLYGKIGPATAGEKQARITAIGIDLARGGSGDPALGKAVFAKQCAACHAMHGEGGTVGPDLTTADRKNRGYMLAQIVDPSGYIRPEYLAYKIDTVDGRSLTGLVTESNGSVTVMNVVDGQPQRVTVAKADVDAMAPSPVSLMPEKLLDSLPEADVRHLFAYLAADAPTPVKADTPKAKKLRVGLVSGSLEYKSDESLTAFQKHLEANFPVECVRAFRKTDTDIPGLEALATCDVVVFFTRRLSPAPEQLELIKKYVASGKPIVGVRTASHGFQNWLAMDAEVFGGSYKNHTKHNVPAEVTPDAAAMNHPILKGVMPFKTTGGLYINPTLAEGTTRLMTATTGKDTQPVAWVRARTIDGGVTQRVFYTSLGTPDDFADPAFVRLLTNGVMWAAGVPVPAAPK